MNKLIVYTDGGARGNPGPAAIGVVVYDDSGKELKRFGRVIDFTTNNQAEYRALIAGLEAVVSLGAKEVVCYLDSELVVRQIQGKYKVREQSLKEPMMQVIRLKNQIKNVEFRNVPREKNKLADQLVNEALDEAGF
ncbi:MAG: ribonuclease HI family protein [Candidatus Doudnabacteria bacterium]